jgi:hypothetical protein
MYTPLLSPVAGTTMLVLLNSYLVVSTIVYVSNINHFPISQRLPIAVLVELVAAFVIANTSLLFLSFGTTANSFFGNCGSVSLIFAFAANVIFTTTTSRFAWLSMKDFLTQEMISLRDSVLSKPNPNCLRKKVQGLLKLVFSRLNMKQCLFLAVIPYVINSCFQIIALSMSGLFDTLLYSADCDALVQNQPTAWLSFFTAMYLMVSSSVISSTLVSIRDSLKMTVELRAMNYTGMFTVSTGFLLFLPSDWLSRLFALGIRMTCFKIPIFVAKCVVSCLARYWKQENSREKSTVAISLANG